MRIDACVVLDYYRFYEACEYAEQFQSCLIENWTWIGRDCCGYE